MKYVNDILQMLLDQYHRLGFYQRDKHFVSEHSIPRFTKSELRLINKNWAGHNLCNADLIYPRMFKLLYGRLPEYFLTDYQITEVFRKTNPEKQSIALENKAMLDVYFPEIPSPSVILKCISGVFYNNTMDIITIDECISVAKSQDSFIIKPTRDTGCGRGVKKINTNEYSTEDLRSLFLSYNGDFIVQEVLTQCKEIQELNPTSINSCRITSLFLDGKYGMSSIIKVGKKGAILDNWNSSYLIGVDEKGQLNEYGLDSNLNKVYQSDNGIHFKGIRIPCFENMCSFVEKAHKNYFPQIGIVGWDILIDSNYLVKVIEVNLATPGVLGEQLAAGDFFKEYKEIINKKISK